MQKAPLGRENILGSWNQPEPVHATFTTEGPDFKARHAASKNERMGSNTRAQGSSKRGSDSETQSLHSASTAMQVSL